MGQALDYSKEQFSAINNVLNFSVNVMDPNRHGAVTERNGTNVNSFPAEGKDQVLADFNECLECNPQLMQQIRLQQKKSWIVAALWGIGFVVMVTQFILLATTHGQPNIGSAAGFGIMLIAMIVGCIVGGKANKLADQWRLEVVTALQTKLGNWKAMYPAFTFTIIYPVDIWKTTRRQNERPKTRKVAIFLHVRITQGPCLATQTGPNEPVFDTTPNVVGSTVGVEQQMVMQQQMNQPLMVQGDDGQMVQGAQVMEQQPLVIVQQQQPVGEALPTYPAT